MPNFLRMIFGLQVAESTQVTVSQKADLSKENLNCVRKDGARFWAQLANGAWSVALDPGDYLVSIESPTWVAGPLQVAFAGNRAPLVIRHAEGWKPESGPFQVHAWPMTKATVSPIINPKDPWPPPMAVTEVVALDDADGSKKKWFIDQLLDAWTWTEKMRGLTANGVVQHHFAPLLEEDAAQRPADAAPADAAPADAAPVQAPPVEATVAQAAPAGGCGDG